MRLGDPTRDELNELAALEQRGAGLTLQVIKGGRESVEPPAQVDAGPLDLWAKYEAPKLPAGLLPSVIEQFAFRHGEVMGADPAGLAMGALAVCAGAITDHIQLQVKMHDPSWRESARLWVGMVGPPSTKKSPIIREATRPLSRADALRMKEYMAAKAEYDALEKAEQKLREPPAMRRHVVSDATVESLQEVLTHSTTGVLSEQDELSGWFGSMDKYAPGKASMSDRAFWLKAYNGGPYTLDRVQRGSKRIPNLSISLLGGIQPEPIRSIMGDAVDDGLIQRILPVILHSASIGKDVPTGGAVQDYHRLVERLLCLRPPRLDEKAIPLRFAEEARGLRERLEQEHFDLVRALERTSPKLSAHFGKYDGIFARLCIIWHCVEHCDGGEPPVLISERTAARVAEFMELFIRPSAIAFYAGMLGLSDGHEVIVGLASYIVAEKLEFVNARTIQRSTRSLKSFTADECRQLCEKLEAFGWLDPTDPPNRSNTPRWRVNPAVHEMFAEKGRQDADRRQAAREALQSALRRA